MRVIAVVASVVAALAVVPVSAAPPRFCTVLTDTSGDVALSGVPQSSGLVADAHVDVTSAAITVDRQTLVLRIDAEDLSEGRKGAWTLMFVTRGQRAFVSAQNGMWLNVGATGAATGYFAGLSGRGATAATGAFDYSADTITIKVPLSAFGKAAPRPGDVLSGFHIEARERIVHVGPGTVGATDVDLTDSAASTTRYVAGRRC